MFTNRACPSSNQAAAQTMPGTESFDFSDAVVGGGDPRIAELVNEARAQGFTIEERPSSRETTAHLNCQPYGFENVGE